MALGGWKTPAMVFRYTHINTAHLAPSQAKLWGEKFAEVERELSRGDGPA
jgi:hypothetical protein